MRELLTHYGQIDVMWFDGAWPQSQADWKSAELVEMIRSLRPYVELDNVAGAMRWRVSERWSDLATNRDVKNAVGQATAMRAMAVVHERAYLDQQGELREAVARELRSR